MHLLLLCNPLTFQNGCDFFQPFGDLNLLGTMGFAALAADAMGGLPCGFGKEIIAHACHAKLCSGKALKVIVHIKKIGDGDALGTAVDTVAAAGAGDGDKLPDSFGSLDKQRCFLCVQRSEGIHIAGVIQHLCFIAHAAEYYHHIIQ